MYNIHNIKAVLEQNLAKHRYTNYVHPPYELEQKLILAIQQGELERSLEILDQINNSERAVLSKNLHLSLKYSLIATCTLFTRAIIDAGVDSETAFILSDFYINLIDESPSVAKTKKLEYTMLHSFVGLIKTHCSYTYNPLINKLIFYIKHNIEKKLTIKEIAQYVGMHPNYLSTVFKQEVGKTIMEYVNEERIEAIKMYLSYTNLTLHEISEIFHFSHPSYFSAYCKAYLKVTAKEYRRQHSLFDSRRPLADHQIHAGSIPF